MIDWDRAIDIVKTKWGRGHLHDVRDDTYCALGAIGKAVLGEDLLRPDIDWYAKIQENPRSRRMVTTLSGVLGEQYEVLTTATAFAGDGYSTAESAVVFTNDRLIKGPDELVAMFEKAKLKDEEMIQ